MKKMVGFVLAGFLLGFPAVAQECRWNPEGSGGWSDASRWVDGKKPTGAAQDSVVIEGAGVSVPVYDADVETLNFASTVSVGEGAEIVFETDSDCLVKGIFRGAGRLVKNRASTVRFDNPGGSENNYQNNQAAVGGLGEVVINDGVLRLPNRTEMTLAMCKTSVWKPGALALSDSKGITIAGLYGDGVVSNELSRELYFLGGTAANPHEFAGDFFPRVELTPYYSGSGDAARMGYQNLIGTNTAYSATVRIWSYLGAAKIGTIGNPSSLGSADKVYFRGAYNPTLKYLGKGERTDKEFWFHNDCTLGRVDGGESGNVVFAGRWHTAKDAGVFMRVVLDGSNAAGPCVLTNQWSDSASHSTYITKTGSGTWRFESHNARENAGTIAVREGVLQFDSIAEKGVVSSLGTSALTCQDVHGATADPVPYAFLVGDGSPCGANVPTMEYVGENSAVCSTRLFAVNGSGRIVSTGGAMNLAGATAVSSGGHTLVLDGAGRDDVFSSVTNGPGNLAVVKRGTGTWTLSGRIDIDSAYAESGTLRFGRPYSYYRLTLRENWCSGYGLNINGFALLSADGSLQNGTLGSVVNTAANNKPESLGPGEISTCGCGYISGRSIDKAFKYTLNDKGEYTFGLCSFGRTSKYEDSSKWVYVYFRLPADAKPICRYDILSTYAASPSVATSDNGTNGREIKSWSLEGSVNGIDWQMLHDVVKDSAPVTEKNQWYAGNTSMSEGPAGFPIDAVDLDASVASVGAAAGATVECAAGEMEVSKIRIDHAAGCGTLRGLKIAESGVVEVVNEIKGEEMPAYVLDKVEGADALRNWSVTIDGKPSRWRVRRTANGFTVVAPGFTCIVR